jgi:hypothetical protein
MSDARHVTSRPENRPLTWPAPSQTFVPLVDVTGVDTRRVPAKLPAERVPSMTACTDPVLPSASNRPDN